MGSIKLSFAGRSSLAVAIVAGYGLAAFAASAAPFPLPSVTMYDVVAYVASVTGAGCTEKAKTTYPAAHLRYRGPGNNPISFWVPGGTIGFFTHELTVTAGDFTDNPQGTFTRTFTGASAVATGTFQFAFNIRDSDAVTAVLTETYSFKGKGCRVTYYLSMIDSGM